MRVLFVVRTENFFRFFDNVARDLQAAGHEEKLEKIGDKEIDPPVLIIAKLRTGVPFCANKECRRKGKKFAWMTKTRAVAMEYQGLNLLVSRLGV